MPVKFKFRKEKIIIDPVFFMFHEFTGIWNWDKSKGKDKANKLFYFIFFLCDLTEENNFRDIPAEKREKEVLYRVYKDRGHVFPKKEYELLSKAIKCYIENNETSDERILTAFDSKSEEQRKLLEDTKFETIENEVDGVSSFVSNSDIITSGLKELDYVKKQKSAVIASIKKDAMSQRVRGKMVLSPLSKGSIELPDFSVLFAQ